MGVIGGWSEYTSTDAKGFNRNDFSRCCLVATVSGDSPVKYLGRKGKLGTIHFFKRLGSEYGLPERWLSPRLSKAIPMCPQTPTHGRWVMKKFTAGTATRNISSQSVS